MMKPLVSLLNSCQNPAQSRFIKGESEGIFQKCSLYRGHAKKVEKFHPLPLGQSTPPHIGARIAFLPMLYQ
jgi:hypothetical protein